MTERNRRDKSAQQSRIHRGLVGERALIGTRYLADPDLRSEYVRDIAPRTGAALSKILREIFPDPQAAGRPRRMLDLGAGTGAAGAAAQLHFEGELNLVSVDQVPVAGKVHATDITDPAALARTATPGGPFDLVIAAHVLNELYLEETPEKRAEEIGTLVSRWCHLLLADQGTLILIEPALRETSRALLAVRDQLLGVGLHIVAPCFFSGPCPALSRERDWCHDAAPPKAAEPKTPRNDHRVDFSYLVVRGSGEPTTDSTLLRIVSDPLPEKGRLKLFACGVSGRQPIVRLDRHATAANAEFDRLERGDVVRIARTTFAQDGLRVVADTSVARQESRPPR